MRYINKTYIRKVLKTGVLFASVFLFVSGCTDKKNAEKDMIAEYETSVYDASLYEGALFSEGLCVSSKDVLREDCKVDEGLHAAALFDLKRKMCCIPHVFMSILLRQVQQRFSLLM